MLSVLIALISYNKQRKEYTEKKTAALSALSTLEFAHPHRLTQKEDAPDAPHVPGQKTGDNILQTIKLPHHPCPSSYEEGSGFQRLNS